MVTGRRLEQRSRPCLVCWGDGVPAWAKNEAVGPRRVAFGRGTERPISVLRPAGRYPPGSGSLFSGTSGAPSVSPGRSRNGDPSSRSAGEFGPSRGSSERAPGGRLLTESVRDCRAACFDGRPLTRSRQSFQLDRFSRSRISVMTASSSSPYRASMASKGTSSFQAMPMTWDTSSSERSWSLWTPMASEGSQRRACMAKRPPKGSARRLPPADGDWGPDGKRTGPRAEACLCRPSGEAIHQLGHGRHDDRFAQGLDLRVTRSKGCVVDPGVADPLPSIGRGCLPFGGCNPGRGSGPSPGSASSLAGSEYPLNEMTGSLHVHLKDEDRRRKQTVPWGCRFPDEEAPRVAQRKSLRGRPSCH